MSKANSLQNVFVLLLIVFTPLHASSSDSLFVISTQQEFLKNLDSEEFSGPVTEAYKLLFDIIGRPKNLDYVPTARGRVLIDSESPVCMLFNRKTEDRLNSYIFSNPVAFGIGHSLYQHIESRPLAANLLNNNGEVIAVDEILKVRPKQLIIVLPSSSYGENLDNQISVIPEWQKVYRYSGDEHNRQAHMFFKHRADFAVMMSSEVKNYFINNEQVAFRRYSIQNETNPIRLYAMCNKTELAQSWLSLVNTGLDELYQRADYRNAHSRYYNDQDWLLIEKDITKVQSSRESEATLPSAPSLK